jgi:hypothetical protein
LETLVSCTASLLDATATTVTITTTTTTTTLPSQDKGGNRKFQQILTKDINNIKSDTSQTELTHEIKEILKISLVNFLKSKLYGFGIIVIGQTQTGQANNHMCSVVH